MRRRAEAQRMGVTALEVDPMSVIGRSNLANHYVRQNRLDEALEHSERLLSQSPWSAYRLRAEIERARGDVSEAIRWLLLAYQEDPNDALSNADLVFALIDLEMYAEARRITDRESHWIDLEIGNHERAITTVTRRYEVDPDNFDLLLVAQAVMYVARRFDQAYELAKQAFARAEAAGTALFPGVLLRIADIHRRAGDMIAAEAIADEAAVRFEELENTGAEFRMRYVNHALLHAYHDRHKEALDSLRFAIEERGFRGEGLFIDPLLDKMRELPPFRELVTYVKALNAQERQETLQLICLENPVPDAWQPLPETCEGLEKKGVSM